MTDALVSLPPHLRRRLEGALDTGLISASSPPATVRSVLGLRNGGEEVLEDLNALEQTGVSGRAAAAWLRAVEQARARSPSPDLVWSGPEVAGLHARDTRRVYEELLGAARRSVGRAHMSTSTVHGRSAPWRDGWRRYPRFGSPSC